MTERGRGIRRILGVLAAGALAAGGVSACSSAAGSPGTAAQVGSSRITTSQVDAVADDFPASIRQSATSAQIDQFIVQDLVFERLAEQYAAAHKIALAPPSASDEQSYASSLGVPAGQAASNKAITLVAGTQATIASLLKAVPARDNTTADYQEVFSELQVRGVIAPTQTYAQLATAIQDAAPLNLGAYNDLRVALTKQAEGETVVINPRYEAACQEPPCGGFDFPLTTLSDPTTGQQLDTMYVSVGSTRSPAVLDLPAPTDAS